MVDNKLRILAAVNNISGDRLTTVFPRRGQYALDPKTPRATPQPTSVSSGLGDLIGCDLDALRGVSRPRSATEGCAP
jgi:hypothetical protein